MDRTAEAQEKLRPAAEKFPDNWLVQYNMACYACQLGEIEEARAFLARAIELGDAAKVKLMALDDPDLLPLFAASE
jgi:Flp pilus assembly protein TadD